MYNYQAERPSLFTEEGQVQFLKIRDQVKRLIKEAGAVRCQEALKGMSGSTWQHMACLDRMVELGELVCLSDKNVWGQYRVYTEPKFHNY